MWNLNKLFLNCDMGENAGHDELIMPHIHAANIACGYHAGDVDTMQRTVELALKHNVVIGAHPSFPDKENFGRTNMHVSPAEVYELVTQQIFILYQVAAAAGATVQHVKPHGALYNLSAKNIIIADAIARAVKDFDHSLVLVGLSGSCSLEASKKVGLQTASEVFADRRYQDDGSLVPRASAGAVITSVDEALKQVLQMVNEGTVTTFSGNKIPLQVDTICVHGDETGVVDLATGIRKLLDKLEK